MISDFARLLARTLHFSAPAAALVITFTTSLPVMAKNTKHVACTANESGDGWDCQSGTTATATSPKAAPARATEPAPAAAPAPAATSVPAPAVLPAAAALPAAGRDAQPGPAAASPADAPTLPEAAAAPVAAITPAEYPLDWAPMGEVPEGLRDRGCLLCEGRYMDPLADEDQDADPDQADIEADAASTEMQGDMVRFYGGVEVSQGYRRFRGDGATINRETGEAVLTGNVTLREPGVLLQGTRADILAKTGEATLEDSQFVIHADHLRGTAKLLERDADGLIHVHDGSFSYCPPGNEDWMIRADTIDLDLVDGLGTAHDATVDIAGLPVFYTPWLQFPLDDRRRTGLLWPDFGNDSTGGLDITAPIYFNLAPNYDALYSPRYIQDRGLNNELKLRYLNKYLGYWEVGGTYMNSDKRYRDQIPEGKSDDRWLTVVRQNGLVDQRWRSRIDYSKASDVDYMKDLETSSLTAQRRTSLLQLASLDYLGDNWLVNLDVEQYQSLADDINDVYKKLPQLTAQYRSSGTPFELQPILLAQYSNFDADEDVVTGERVYSEGGVAFPMNWSYGFLKPTAKYRQVYYELSDAAFFTDNSPSTGSAMASLDGGLYFERETSFAGEGLLQTLEPRLYYLYSGYENQQDQPDFDSAELTFSYNQLFRETRFSGHDRIDDANRLSVGIGSQLIDSQNGQKLLGANIGQIFHFRDRKVRLIPGAEPLDESSSEIAADLSFTPDRHLNFRTDMVYDPHDGDMDSTNVLAGYTMDSGALFNLGYSYNRPQQQSRLQAETEQMTASTYLPVYTNWHLFGAINYSLIDNQAIEQMLGVEYENCCWIVRVMHLRYYDNDTSGFFPDFNNPDLEQEHTTQVQFVLKGMGGFGSRITNILEDMIRGYKEREY
jgi:LPS-assembly protein